MNTFILATEDFSKSFTLSEINTLPAGNYNVYENGRIKYHHHVIITDADDCAVYYLAAFDRVHDDELFELLDSSSEVDVYKHSVKNHECTFRYYVKPINS